MNLHKAELEQVEYYEELLEAMGDPCGLITRRHQLPKDSLLNKQLIWNDT